MTTLLNLLVYNQSNVILNTSVVIDIKHVEQRLHDKDSFVADELFNKMLCGEFSADLTA